MKNRDKIEIWYRKLHDQFNGHEDVTQFKTGTPNRETVLRFIGNVCKSHLLSPQVLGFLFAVAPPKSRHHLQENLLEEMGNAEEKSHPDMLIELCQHVGIDGPELANLSDDAEMVLKNKISEPLMFGTLQDVGLNVLLEVIGFEWFLARESSQLGRVIQKALTLENEPLTWFYHHSEVDIAHAEEGLDALEEYVRYYNLDDESVQTIAEITFRDNIFLKRYFDVQIASEI